MYFIGKICDPLLLLNIEFSLVYSVSFYFISKLSTGELMKNQSLFSCVDYFSIVECCVLFCQLRFFCKLCKCCKYFIIYCFCSVIVSKILCHRNAVILNTFCSVLTGHHFCKIDTFYFRKFFKWCKCIQIVPINHSGFLLIPFMIVGLYQPFWYARIFFSVPCII